MESLRGKVAIITGASAGIGEGTALLFARYGCLLTLTGRDEDRLAAVVQKCVATGCPADKIITVTGDTRDSSVLQSIVDKTVETFDRIDILVNNAGTIHYTRLLDTTSNQYDDMMNVNMKAVFLLSQIAIPHLIKTKGTIVNVSSICGQRSMPEVGVYCMSKAALDMFTQCLALEVAPQGVRVNSVNPGTVVSLLARRGLGLNDEEYAKFLEIQGAKHPLGGVGQPDDVANTIAFLASDMARFITGQLVFVDGGRHCISAGLTTKVK